MDVRILAIFLNCFTKIRLIRLKIPERTFGMSTTWCRCYTVKCYALKFIIGNRQCYQSSVQVTAIHWYFRVSYFTGHRMLTLIMLNYSRDRTIRKTDGEYIVHPMDDSRMEIPRGSIPMYKIVGASRYWNLEDWMSASECMHVWTRCKYGWQIIDVNAIAGFRYVVVNWEVNQLCRWVALHPWSQLGQVGRSSINLLFIERQNSSDYSDC